MGQPGFQTAGAEVSVKKPNGAGVGPVIYTEAHYQETLV